MAFRRLRFRCVEYNRMPCAFAVGMMLFLAGSGIMFAVRKGNANPSALVVMVGNNDREQQDNPRRQHKPTDTFFALLHYAAKIKLFCFSQNY